MTLNVIAKHRNAPMSPQKLRLVADQVRGLPADKALQLLSFSVKKGAVLIKKVIESALSNAENNFGADIDELKVQTIMVDESTRLRRFQARAKGRANRIVKPRSHITVIVSNH